MKTGYLYIALTTVLFSTMEIALKTVAADFNPVQMNLIRFCIGGIFLLPLSLVSLRKRGIKLRPNDFLFFSFTGLIGITVSMTLYQFAITASKASIVAIIFSCNAVFVIPFAALILKEKIRRYTIISMIISVLGMISIMNPFDISAGYLVGILLSVLAAVTFALYGVVGKTRSIRYGGLVTTCFSFIMASLEILALVLISRIPSVAEGLTSAGLGVFTDIPILNGIELSTLPVLAYVSLCVTGIGYTFYFLAIEKTSASMAALIFYIKPALAPVLAFIILNETIEINTLIGICLIAAGSVVAFAGNAKIRSRENVKNRRITL